MTAFVSDQRERALTVIFPGQGQTTKNLGGPEIRRFLPDFGFRDCLAAGVANPCPSPSPIRLGKGWGGAFPPHPLPLGERPPAGPSETI
jgi:hypothetical protein